MPRSPSKAPHHGAPSQVRASPRNLSHHIQPSLRSFPDWRIPCPPPSAVCFCPIAGLWSSSCHFLNLATSLYLFLFNYSKISPQFTVHCRADFEPPGRTSDVILTRGCPSGASDRDPTPPGGDRPTCVPGEGSPELPPSPCCVTAHFCCQEGSRWGWVWNPRGLLPDFICS